MAAPLNIQPNFGAADTGVASIDGAGNERIAGSMTVGNSLLLSALPAPPVQVPGYLRLYTLDGQTLSTTGGAGTPGGAATVGSTDWFNAKAFGAVGNGVANDAPAISQAIAAAAVNGGVVYLPAGNYSLASGLVLTTGVTLLGAGASATVLTPVTGALFDVVSTPIPGAAGTPGFIQSFVGVENLGINGANMAGTTNGQGNGIHFYGARYSHVYNCNISGVPNFGVVLDGDTTNFSYSTRVFGNRIINGAAGIMTVFSEEAFITNNNILQANATTAAQQPAFAPQTNVGYLVRLVAGYSLLLGNVIGSSGTYTSAAVQVENAGPTRIEGNRFDQCRGQGIRTTGPNTIIIGNQFGNLSSVLSVEGIRLGSTGNIVADNMFDITNGAAHYTYCILEPGAEGSNVIRNNKLVAGTAGTISLNAASVGNTVSGNVGYNPVGSIAPPAFPATTVPVTNNTGVDVTAYVVGATVTVITVAGVVTGLTGTAAGTAVRIPTGSTVAFTYASGTPSWTWYGD